MPNLVESIALLACFFAMGMDTTTLDEITAPMGYEPAATIIIVECDTDTDCMVKNPHIDPDNFMGE